MITWYHVTNIHLNSAIDWLAWTKTKPNALILFILYTQTLPDYKNGWLLEAMATHHYTIPFLPSKLTQEYIVTITTPVWLKVYSKVKWFYPLVCQRTINYQYYHHQIITTIIILKHTHTHTHREREREREIPRAFTVYRFPVYRFTPQLGHSIRRWLTKEILTKE